MTEQERKKTYNSIDYRSLTQSERAVFRCAVDELVEKGLFNTADTPVIAGYARNVVLARTASKDVERYGINIAFQDRGCDKIKENPAIGVMLKAQSAYEATALKLGLTPAGRKRMKGEGVVQTDEADLLVHG